MMIVLIGPMSVGKSTVANLLAERLHLPRYCLDKSRWAYYREIGFDEQHARELAAAGSLNEALRYCKPFEVHAVERHMAEHRDGVVDFGAGYSVQDDPALQERVRKALAPYENIVLLLPSPDVAESVAYLNERIDPNLSFINEHYITHPANRSLAKVIVYTRGKTPEEVCEEIESALDLKPSAGIS